MFIYLFIPMWNLKLSIEVTITEEIENEITDDMIDERFTDQVMDSGREDRFNSWSASPVTTCLYKIHEWI